MNVFLCEIFDFYEFSIFRWADRAFFVGFCVVKNLLS